MRETSLFSRLSKFAVIFGITLTFVYVLLPLLTDSVDILHEMSISLEDNGINPSSYYYTDVPQVFESEQYLRTVLDDR